jgi:ribosomal protein S18 acetylase RimI-like enzyme
MTVIKFAPGLKPVLKHQEHDQATHGSWANGVSTTQQLLLSQASKFETFEEFSFAFSQEGLRPKMWHIADEGFQLDPNRKPTNRLGGQSGEAGLFVGDPETWQDYAIGRNTVIEYDMTGLTWTKKPLADTKADFYSDQSGNQGFFVRPQGFGKLKEVGRFTVQEAINRATKQQNEIPKSKEEAQKIWEESRSLQKHAQHDQSTHGNWADSGSPKLTILGKNDGTNEYFNESTRVVRYQPEKGKATDYVLYDRDKGEIVVIKKPSNETTINGFDSTYRGVVGSMVVATGESARTWRKQSEFDGKATVAEVGVDAPHRRRGLASAMLRFHRDRYPELDLQHSDLLLQDGKAWAEVAKHAQHNQQTHGNWATGGNGLGIEEVIRLHKSSDPLQSKVYEAEQSIDAPSKNPLEEPTNPDHRLDDNFQSTADYEKAWKDYNKKWMAWAVEAQAMILSETGKTYLDGTPAGVKKYVEQVIKQDWFVERFGDGSSLPKLEVKTSNTNASGRHILKMQKDRASGRIIKTVHEISLDRQSVKNERTILHEISHYATAISQTESFAGHGVEFARNHLFVVEQAVGSARAQTLESAYTAKGVLNGN